MTKVKIYTTTTCQYCKAAKQYFKDNSVDYQEIDVSTDTAKQQEMIKLSGQMGVPVIEVTTDDGEKEVITGFDQIKLAKLLGLSA